MSCVAAEVPELVPLTLTDYHLITKKKVGCYFGGVI
jgi:hypothetical protein